MGRATPLFKAKYFWSEAQIPYFPSWIPSWEGRGWVGLGGGLTFDFINPYGFNTPPSPGVQMRLVG
ncbi:hypothetical protein [Okeania sp. SIO2B9]|uniref:Uncharacterized protein n=1 Tax=Okeania hirsuta TaxID=1458930 RepID=A0A3N6PCT2_9CYAN|nr:hypothetical protein [Okeania sp. SIO2B9]NET22204.1 hypothetical protein [Okeania sp. SIO1H5]RQH22562.1 hypothetical protein D4Z78_07330 [Okeania hirsuta]RQH57452.1 hypothetical protein D5R40_01135 [Okeania hirsuta]